MSAKEYTPEQQELFNKIGDAFKRLNMNGQGDAIEKVNFKNGELGIMKKDGKVMVEFKSVMKHFANPASLERFLDDNLTYYMNKITGKMAKANNYGMIKVYDNGSKIDEVEFYALKEISLTKLTDILRNHGFSDISVKKGKNAGKTVILIWSGESEEYGTSNGEFLISGPFEIDSIQKAVQASVRDSVLASNGIEFKNRKINKEQAVRAAHLVRNSEIKKTEAYIRVDVDEKYKQYFNDYNNLKSTLTFLEYAEEQLGCPLEWSDDDKCFIIYDEDMNCDPEKLKKMLPNLVSASADSKKEISKETLEDIRKDKDLIKAIKELPKLEKEAARIKKEVAPIYNKFLEKYDFKDSRDNKKITDYNKLYKADSDTDEYYKEVNKELMAKYPGTKDGHCPALVADGLRINKENEILDKMKKYYSFIEHMYKLEDRKQFLDLQKRMFAEANVEAANVELYGKDEMQGLSAMLIAVQNSMKDGMHNLNLAIQGNKYELKKIADLIEACNLAANCSAAKDIFK